MNYYFLRDDYDSHVVALLITTRSQEEVQAIVNDIRENNEDDYFDEMMTAFDERNIRVIRSSYIDNIVY